MKPVQRPTAEEKQAMQAFDDAVTKWVDDSPEYAVARMYSYLHLTGWTYDKAHKVLVKAGASD